VGGTNGGGLFVAVVEVRDSWMIEADVPAGWCEREVLGGG
jgi:hypothetical protein